MCLDDYKIGARIIGKAVSKVVPSASSTEFIGNDDDRVSIVFLPPAAGSITYLPLDAVTSGDGVVMRSTDRPVKLLITEVGNVVQQPWTAIADAGTPTGRALVGTLPGLRELILHEDSYLIE